MKVFLRLVFLRFDVLELQEKQQYCPVGIFFRPEGAQASASVFIEFSNKTPYLPIILSFPDQVFPSIAMNEGPLDKIKVSPLYGNEFRLGEVFSIEVPDDTKKLDKVLFVDQIASHERFANKRPIYRFTMNREYMERIGCV